MHFLVQHVQVYNNVYLQKSIITKISLAIKTAASKKLIQILPNTCKCLTTGDCTYKYQ